MPVLMLTGHASVELAVDAMKSGAVDFLTKPVSLAKLKLLLDKALLANRREQALAYHHHPGGADAALTRMISDSAPMSQLRAAIERLILIDGQSQDSVQAMLRASLGEPAPEPVRTATVLILGETGTGKEMVAHAMHFNGPRRSKPFIEINCAAMPAHLIEAELFGRESVAADRQIGLIETAEGGTLFLDEVGDLGLDLQAKLLQLLEERTMRRIGGERELRVDVRIIAASHRPLEAMVSKGLFRADLYFRLSVVRLMIAPLRERSGDVLQLAGHFLAQLARSYGRSAPSLSEDAQAKLLAHRRPGNVRELRNVLEQALMLTQAPVLEARNLTTSSIPDWLPPSPFHLARIETAAERFDSASNDPLLDREHRRLVEALESCNWNVSRTAFALAMSRDALRYPIKKHGLKRETKFYPRG